MTIVSKKVFVIFFIVLLFCSEVFSQSLTARDTDPPWLALERGKKAFDNRDFGTALLAFDAAINSRRSLFETADKKLKQVMRSRIIKKADNSISAALSLFAAEDFMSRDYEALKKNYGSSLKSLLISLKKERISDDHRAFVDVLLVIMDYKTIEQMEDSLENLKKSVSLLTVYPEAEYWKGRTFFIEGELGLAETQYKRAFSMRDSLDIPEQKFVIKYSFVELYKARKELKAWEETLLSIVSNDDVKYDPGAGDFTIDSFLRDAMIKTLEQAPDIDGNNGFDRFMTLYRIPMSITFTAHKMLSEYYLENGREDHARLHSAIAINMLLSNAIELIELNDRHFAWTKLSSFYKAALDNRIVIEYLENNDFWQIGTILAESLYLRGSRSTAIDLWNFIAEYADVPYKTIANNRLNKKSK